MEARYAEEGCRSILKKCLFSLSAVMIFARLKLSHSLMWSIMQCGRLMESHFLGGYILLETLVNVDASSFSFIYGIEHSLIAFFL